jgi:chromosome segregation ATPase
MRYIKRIILKNFQSYKDQEIILKPGLNLILGSSDSGKSAIMRAISFVFYNNPRSKTLIHTGEVETSVIIEFDDGVAVTRILGERNAYEYKLPDGTHKYLDRIDKSVPDEIKTLLGNPPEDDFNGFISYADQFSKMFLVDLSPTDLPRSLSNLAGIEILEETAKELMSSYKQIEKQIKIDDKRLKSLSEERVLYNCLDTFKPLFDKANEYLSEISGLESEIIELTEFIDGVDLNVDEKCVETYQSILNEIDEISHVLTNAIKIADELYQLEIFHIAVGDNNEEDIISTLEEALLDIEKAELKLQKAHDISKIIYDYMSIDNEYSHIRQTGINLTNEHSDLQKEIEESEKDLADFRRYLVEQKIQCESCGSILV